MADQSLWLCVEDGEKERGVESMFGNQFHFVPMHNPSQIVGGCIGSVAVD